MKDTKTGREEIELCLFPGDVIVYIDNSKESTKKTPKPNKQTNKNPPRTSKEFNPFYRIQDKHIRINCISMY